MKTLAARVLAKTFVLVAAAWLICAPSLAEASSLYIQWERDGTVYSSDSITVSGSSAQSGASPSFPGAYGGDARVTAEGAAIMVTSGANPTATQTSSVRLDPGQSIVIHVNPGDKIAAILSSVAAGSQHVTIDGGGLTGGTAGGVTIADGDDVTKGAKADAACGADTATCTQIALMKRELQRLTTLITNLGSPFQAGGSIGNSTFGVTGTFWQATQPVSLANLLYSQGSTTSGQSGVVVMCASTTSAPSETNGQTYALNCDPNGFVRVTAPASAPLNVTVNTPPNDVATGPTSVTGATDVSVSSQGAGSVTLQVTGTFTGLSGVVQASDDNTNWQNIGFYVSNGGAIVTSGTALTATGLWSIPAGGYRSIRFHVTAVSTGTAVVTLNASAGALDPPNSVASGGKSVTATNFPGTVDTNSGAAGANTVRVVAAASGATHGQTNALATAKVLKASAGVLYTLDVQADSTLYAAVWYVLVFDATSDPGNGAVTPAKCYAVPAGQASFTAGWPSNGVAMATGITAVVSTTGCFNETQSAHAFIGGEFQ